MSKAEKNKIKNYDMVDKAIAERSFTWEGFLLSSYLVLLCRMDSAESKSILIRMKRVI